MPLPPLPDNNTSRVWLSYTSVGVTHEMMFRLPDFAVASDAVAQANSLALVLKTHMASTDTTQGARFSPAHTNFSVPIAHTPQSGAVAFSFWAQDPESVQLSYTGRSFSDGRSVAWQFFDGQTFGAWPGDNRFNFGDSVTADTLWTNFNAWVQAGVTPAQQIVTISGTIPTLNPYTNIRANGYWQNAQR